MTEIHFNNITLNAKNRSNNITLNAKIAVKQECMNFGNKPL